MKKSKTCFLIGHKMYVGKDDKSVYCKRCEQKVGFFKKGYAEIGMDLLRKRSLLFGVILDPTMIILVVFVILIIMGYI